MPFEASYKNPWHQPKMPQYGPEFYNTNAKPVEHAGHQIYERIDGNVWDVVKDGVCVSQMAGINGAKKAAEESAQWIATHGYKVGDMVQLAEDYEARMLTRIRAGKNEPGDLSVTDAGKLAEAQGVVSRIFASSDKASVQISGKSYSLGGDCVKLVSLAPQATFEELKQRAQELIDEDDDLVYDTAAENGQIVGNVKHMHGFKLRIMQAITESEEQFAHLADEVADALQPAARRTSSPSM